MEINADSLKNMVVQRVIALKKERESDSAFARRCGLKQTTFAGYVNGKSQFSAESLQLIAAANNVSLDWLMTGEGTPRKQVSASFVQPLTLSGNTPTQTDQSITTGRNHQGHILQAKDSPGGTVTVNEYPPETTVPELSPREQVLILRMRRYGNQATWDKIEAILDGLERESR